MVSKMDLIYMFGYSPRETRKLEALLPILKIQASAGKNVAVVLMHDGVIGAEKRSKTPTSLHELVDLSVKVYALAPDLRARGMNPEALVDKIESIDYGQLVDLLAETPKIASWI